MIDDEQQRNTSVTGMTDTFAFGGEIRGNPVDILVKSVRAKALKCRTIAYRFLIGILFFLGSGSYGVIQAPSLVSYDVNEVLHSRSRFMAQKQSAIINEEENYRFLVDKLATAKDNIKGKLSGGGAAWLDKSWGSPVRLNAVAISSSGKQGWAVGRNGLILSLQGDDTWTPDFVDVQDAFTDVNFIGQSAVAVGENAEIWINTKGKSWQQKHTAEVQSAIEIISNGSGSAWLVGEYGMLYSTIDQGRSWQPQNSHTTTNLHNINFSIDRKRGWILGKEGTLLISNDSGQSWERSATGTTADLRKIEFSKDGTRAWIIGGRQLLVSNDGGQSWQPRETGTTNLLRSIQFSADGTKGWIIAGESILLLSVDGAQSWQRQNLGSPVFLRQIKFAPDDLRGWIIGGEGVIFFTNDGGQNWLRQKSGTTADLLDIEFSADGRRGWIVGGGGTLLVSTDGGFSWEHQDAGTLGDLLDIKFVETTNQGWIVGGDGIGGNSILLASTDGGQNWEHQETDTSGYLRKINFSDDGQMGWIQNLQLHIALVSTNSGQTWEPLNLPGLVQSKTQVDFSAVDISDTGHQIRAIGAKGTLLISQDGGESWSLTNTGTDATLFDLWFGETGSVGWISGENGTLLHSMDGGVTWTNRQHPAAKHDLRSLHFLSGGLRGWIVGTSGTILHTTDGGTTWSHQASHTQVLLTQIYFLEDGRNGWVIGLDGTLVRTKNGGKTWMPVKTGVDQHLYDIMFSAEGTAGWIVGAGGLLLKSQVDLNLLDGLNRLSSDEQWLLYLKQENVSALVGGKTLVDQFTELKKTIKFSEEYGKILQKEMNTLKDLKFEVSGSKIKDPYFFLSTNTIRFGLLFAVLFLAHSLFKAYRYNIQLAAYYDGLVDALTLLQFDSDLRSKTKDMDLKQLVDTFIPRDQDFGMVLREKIHY